MKFEYRKEDIDEYGIQYLCNQLAEKDWILHSIMLKPLETTYGTTTGVTSYPPLNQYLLVFQRLIK